MGSNQSKLCSLRCIKRTPSLDSTQAPPSLAPTQAPPGLAPTQAPPTQAPRRRIPDLQFRVLVIGRANAGKTTILQRVCDTTESPTIYRGGEEVSYPNFCPASDLTVDQFKLEPSMNVSDTRTCLRLPIDIVPARRAQH